MLVTKSTKGYTSRRKYVDGKGFVDSLTSSLKSITSYVAQNKDLIAKPLLGAVGNLAATGLEESGKALLSHIMNKVSKKKKMRQENFQSDDVGQVQFDAKGKELLRSIVNNTASSSDRAGGTANAQNIIGSGARDRTGGGIKRF
jgi:hypothetical protein